MILNEETDAWESLILINMKRATVSTLMPYEPTPFPDRKERSDCVSPTVEFNSGFQENGSI